MARITSYSKQVIAVLLSLLLFLVTPAYAMFGGWSVGTPNYQGAGNFYYPATKTTMLNGKPSNKTSGFTVPVSPARVAKLLAGGVGAVALAEAVTMLVGAGVDWVLDPANNQIKYNVPTCIGDCGQYVWVNPAVPGGLKFSTGAEACNAIRQIGGGFQNYVFKSLEGTTCIYDFNGQRRTSLISRTINPDYVQEEEEKTLSLDVVAQKVISNADTHSNADQRRAAVTVLQTAANDIVNEAENDATKARPFVNEMERGASTSTSESATGSATTRPSENTGEQAPPAPPADIALEFPVFCGWAPLVCEAAQEAIIFPQTVAEWWSITKDWASSVAREYSSNPDVPSDTKLDIPEPDIPQPDTDIYFSSACPQPLSYRVTFMGLNENIEFSYQPLCDIASFIKPIVISAAAFSAALIVAGIRTEDS